MQLFRDSLKGTQGEKCYTCWLHLERVRRMPNGKERSRLNLYIRYMYLASGAPYELESSGKHAVFEGKLQAKSSISNKILTLYCLFVFLMVFNANLNNISVSWWRTVFVVGGRFNWWRKLEKPTESRPQTLSHNVVQSPWSRFELTTLVVVSTECMGSYESNYHSIIATIWPLLTLYYRFNSLEIV